MQWATNVFTNFATVAQTMKDSMWVRAVIDYTVLWKPVKYQVITYIQIFRKNCKVIQRIRVNMCDKLYYKGNTLSRKTETSYIKYFPATWEENVTIWLASPIFLLSWSVQCWPKSKEPKSMDAILSCERNKREAYNWRWNREGRYHRTENKW